MTEQKPRSFIAEGAAAMVSSVLESRRRRQDFFSAELFADAAWDILLRLFLAQLDGRKIGAADLQYSSAIPKSTTKRWIDKLERDGWVRRAADTAFPARQVVELSGAGSRAMNCWLNAWADHLSQARCDPVDNILERIERGRRHS
jgi:DNA-binding MarR family transcriptional regulator